MMTINFDTITNNYEVIYVIKTVMKYHLKKIDTSFHQPLPNMVQRLFADVINDAIWFMNIHLHLHLHSTTIHQNSDDYTSALRKQTLYIYIYIYIYIYNNNK